MSKQPELLRLADYLECEWVTGDCLNAAKELRRLHAANVGLIDLVTNIAERMEDHPTCMPDATDEEMEREGGDSAEITYIAQICRKELAKHGGQPCAASPTST